MATVHVCKSPLLLGTHPECPHLPVSWRCSAISASSSVGGMAAGAVPAAARPQPLSHMDVCAVEEMPTGFWVGPVQGMGCLLSWAPADGFPSPWAPELVSATMRGRAQDLRESSKLEWTQGTQAPGQSGFPKLSRARAALPGLCIPALIAFLVSAGI